MSDDTVTITFNRSDFFHLWCVLTASLSGDACDSVKKRTQGLLDIVDKARNDE